VDKPAYEAASAEVMSTLREIDGVWEVMGWDEAFLGVVTDDPDAVARRIQERVRSATQLDCSGRDRPEQAAGETGHRVR